MIELRESGDYRTWKGEVRVEGKDARPGRCANTGGWLGEGWAWRKEEVGGFSIGACGVRGPLRIPKCECLNVVRCAFRATDLGALAGLQKVAGTVTVAQKFPLGKAGGWKDGEKNQRPEFLEMVNLKGVSERGQPAIPGPWWHPTEWKGNVSA